MNRALRSRHRAAPLRRGVALLCAFALVACHGYYPTWHYAPQNEIHALHLSSSGGNANPDADARIGAELIGILRPENGGPRRIHARFGIDDCGRQDLVFKTAQTRITPNGGAALAVSPSSADVAVAAGTKRSVEVFFDLPDLSTLSNQAIEQLELEWTVEIGGTPHTSKAIFHRAEYVDPYPYYGYGDPYWYGPIYWYDPNYWHYGYPGRCGYYWH